MNRLALALAVLGLACAARAQEDQPRLMDLSGQKFSFEKEGTFAMLHCVDKKWDGCVEFENLAPQLNVDWEGLLAKARAKKQASATYVDQFGGLWKLTLGAKVAAVSPMFPGYELTGTGPDAHVDVMGNQQQWQAARHELGLDKPKKRGLSALFE